MVSGTEAGSLSGPGRSGASGSHDGSGDLMGPGESGVSVSTGRSSPPQRGNPLPQGGTLEARTSGGILDVLSPRGCSGGAELEGTNGDEGEPNGASRGSGEPDETSRGSGANSASSRIGAASGADSASSRIGAGSGADSASSRIGAGSGADSVIAAIL